MVNQEFFKTIALFIFNCLCNKSKKITIIITLSLFIMPFIALAELYNNQEYKFSLAVPDGWITKKSAMPNTVIKFVYRDTSRNIAVLSIAAYPDISGVITSDKMLETFKVEYPDFTINRISFGIAKISSKDAVWNLIEIINPQQARLIGKHYHFRIDSKLWRISAMTDSGKDFFATVLPIMEKAIATIEFDKN